MSGRSWHPPCDNRRKIMNFTYASNEEVLRQKMDSRTIAEQEREIQYLRRRLEKLSAARTGKTVRPAPVIHSSTQPSLAA